jgi:type VI secretion system protein ImpA
MSPQWESQELLQPITAEQPCGENLEDTALLASFDTFRVFGKSTPLDPPPEWAAIRARALEALSKSKDIRLLAYLGTASLRTDGLPAFAETLKVASQWLQEYWAGTYPLIDEDAILRRNALNYFADPMAVIDGLRRLPLVSSRQHGTFSLRDIDIAAGLLQPTDGDARPDERRIDAAFEEMPLEELQAQQAAVAGGIQALKSIETAMAAEGGPEAQPGFEALAAHLVKIDRVLRTRLAARTGTGGATEPGMGEGASGNGQPATVAVGAIRSRQDAIRALDAVAEFFKANEPSSPVPMLIDRAKRLVSKNFLEVLADIAPDAVPQARSAGGLSQEESG